MCLIHRYIIINLLLLILSKDLSCIMLAELKTYSINEESSIEHWKLFDILRKKAYILSRHL